MHHRTDLIYLYDGSFDGFLCCVFRAIYQKEDPMMICPAEEAQPTLLEPVVIDTEDDKAQRVRKSIPAKLGSDAQRVVYLCFLSDRPDKEVLLLAFLRLGYQAGSRVLRMLTDERVHPVLTAARAVSGEAHLLKGFTRFSQYGGALAAEIEPKNHVLPLLAQHFKARMPGESFLILDRTHQMVLICSGGHWQIHSTELARLPRADAREQFYRQLWTRFYDTVAIEDRYNPQCRMTHMPKRFWGMMTEFQAENRPWALPETTENFPEN
ncbi:MAG: TIGR03915 family putative DNA repair protein [Clostridia bacterium]|nr:TIGR03915 family putative DNA repair protein [Clostridia bacterium]